MRHRNDHGAKHVNPNASSGQLGEGMPGGFPLPEGGEPGTAYTANKLHPAALAAAAPASSPALTTSAAPSAAAVAK